MFIIDRSPGPLSLRRKLFYFGSFCRAIYCVQSDIHCILVTYKYTSNWVWSQMLCWYSTGMCHRLQLYLILNIAYHPSIHEAWVNLICFSKRGRHMFRSWLAVYSAPYHHTITYDVIMGAMASQTTSLTIVYSTVYSGADHRKHQSSASLAFVGGIHRGPVNSPHKWPVTRKMLPFDDVIMPFNQSTHV